MGLDSNRKHSSIFVSSSVSRTCKRDQGGPWCSMFPPHPLQTSAPSVSAQWQRRCLQQSHSGLVWHPVIAQPTNKDKKNSSHSQDVQNLFAQIEM